MSSFLINYFLEFIAKGKNRWISRCQPLPWRDTRSS